MLQRTQDWIIVEFDLPPSQAAYHTPPVIFGKLPDFRIGHLPENSKLRRLCHQVLGPGRQHTCDLRG